MLWALLSIVVCMTALSSPANAETRSLKLYYLHTGERAEITFKRNGRYIDSGLKKINTFLRDWRRNEPTKMDPRLLDLVWEVYKEAGSKKHIHVISGYRSPATNNLLRKRGRGVAKKSQHTLGKALDFFIPGVPLRKLRNIALKKGLGGVGYYPKSGSPFIHMDTGRVRHWPRMSRKELVKVFPKGDTLHVPTDGKPLARYNQAKATYERKINGRDKIVVAKAEEIERKPRLFERLLGRDGEEEEGATGIVAAPKPVRTTVQPAATANTPSQGQKPLGAIPGFETPAKPEQEPVSEPDDSPETILAALPASALPVPLVAPRAVELAEPTEPEITSEPELEPEVTPALEIQEPAPTILAEAPTSPSAEPERELDLARILPSRRPEAEVIEQINLSEASEPTPNLSAYQRYEQIQASALSPNEIQDLRQQVYATLRETPPSPIQKPVPSVPVPGAESLVTANLQSTSAPASTVRALETQALSSVTSQPENTIGTGSADNSESVTAPQEQINETQPTDNLATTPGFVVPQPNPARTVLAALQEPATELSPIEPGVETTEVAAIPSPNPVRPEPEPEPQTEIAALEEEPGIDEQTVAGLAIPTPAFRQTPEPIEEPIVIASASQAIEETRELELERFQAPGTDDRLVGKWALASDTTISQISEIQPPAYGRNVIRELPVTVLSRGFSRENIDKFTLGFTGSSLEFLDFKRFN